MPMRDIPALALKNLTVLVVDDEPAVRRLLQLVLGEVGAVVTAVGTVKEAQIATNAQVPDVVISDGCITTEAGSRWLASLRDRRTSRGRPRIVLFSGLPIDLVREQGAAAWVDLQMEKPLAPAEIVAGIYRLLTENPD